jgi:hypothetical protein
MTRKEVDFDLQVRVRKYLEHLWLEEEIENREIEVQIMNRLSDSLREELLVQANGKVLAKFDLFIKFFSEDVLEKVSQIVTTVNYAPDDIIIYVIRIHPPHFCFFSQFSNDFSFSFCRRAKAQTT